MFVVAKRHTVLEVAKKHILIFCKIACILRTAEWHYRQSWLTCPGWWHPHYHRRVWCRRLRWGRVICRLKRRWDHPYWRPKRYWRSDSTLRFRSDTNLYSDEISDKSSDKNSDKSSAKSSDKSSDESSDESFDKSSDKSSDESFDESTFKDEEFEDIDSYLASL